ncbi:hypothetical protein DMUE_5389, partial [Dictyocoela muelleri]
EKQDVVTNKDISLKENENNDKVDMNDKDSEKEDIKRNINNNDVKEENVEIEKNLGESVSANNSNSDKTNKVATIKTKGDNTNSPKNIQSNKNNSNNKKSKIGEPHASRPIKQKRSSYNIISGKRLNPETKLYELKDNNVIDRKKQEFSVKNTITGGVTHYKYNNNLGKYDIYEENGS